MDIDVKTALGDTLQDVDVILRILPLLPKESRDYLRGYFEGLIAARETAKSA